MFRNLGRVLLLGTLILIATVSTSHAVRVRTNCGTPIQSVTFTENAKFQTTSTNFVRVTGAAFTVVVPTGATRCVKVKFTAAATCEGTTGQEHCFIRALAGTAEMNPAGGGTQSLAPRSSIAMGLSYSWVTRLSAGSHVVQIQARRDPVVSTTVGLDDWTMEIEILN